MVPVAKINNSRVKSAQGTASTEESRGSRSIEHDLVVCKRVVLANNLLATFLEDRGHSSMLVCATSLFIFCFGCFLTRESSQLWCFVLCSGLSERGRPAGTFTLIELHIVKHTVCSNQFSLIWICVTCALSFGRMLHLRHCLAPIQNMFGMHCRKTGKSPRRLIG